MDSDLILKLANKQEDEKIRIWNFNQLSRWVTKYIQRTSLSTETVLTLIYTFMDG